MIEKINYNQITDFLKQQAAGTDATKIPVNNEDAQLQVNFDDSLSEMAKQTEQTDAEAVQNAQQLLASGQLESPENIQEAAENIVEFGI